MKSTSFLILSAAVLITACNEGQSKAEGAVVKSDTVISGLEGTRDQTGQLLTDVKPDTTSGQTQRVRPLGEQATNAASIQTNSATPAGAFLSEAIAGNAEETSLARLAMEQSGNKAVKSIAAELVKDHSSALKELKSLAGKKDVDVTNSTGQTNDLTGLQVKQGAAFDKAWCELLMDKHKATIARYEAAASGSADADLKQWISKTLPKLRMHNDHLMALHGKL